MTRRWIATPLQNGLYTGFVSPLASFSAEELRLCRNARNALYENL
jgi:hypothetical protein